MPTYRYRDAKGRIVEMIRQVADRDKPLIIGKRQLRRITVPERVGISVAGQAPDLLREQIRKGYQKLEERDGSRFRSEHGKRKIKEVWKL